MKLLFETENEKIELPINPDIEAQILDMVHRDIIRQSESDYNPFKEGKND